MHNLEKKEQIIMRDSKFATMMQQQEEDKFAEIDGKRTAGHDINTDREGFAYHSECTFLALFYSVFHISKLGRRLKSNNLGNRQYVFLRGFFTPSTSII